MVSRPRLRSLISALCLHLTAALVIGYFGVHAYIGDRGLKARMDLDQQIAKLSAELAVATAERRKLENRVSLLKSDRLDPDILDERARALLNYVGRRDVVVFSSAP